MDHTISNHTFRGYLFFLSGQLISLLGSTIIQYVIIWWIVVEYINPIYLSIAYLVGIGVQVLFMPIAGVFVDRWSRKFILGISDFLQAVGALVLIFIFTIKDQLLPLDLYWLVIVLLCFRGITGAFHAPATKAIIPLMVPRQRLNRLNAIQFITLGVINILGPAIGAVLYELYPLTIIIWIDCITFIIAIIPLFLIHIPPIERKNVTKSKNGLLSFLHEFRDGISVLRSTEGLLSLVLVITMINFIEIPIIVLGPYYVYSVHSGQVKDLAFVLISCQLGLMLSGTIVLVKKEWKQKAKIIIIAIYVQILGYFIQAITPIGLFWFMALGAFIFGAMLPIINSLFKTILQVEIEPELQGRVTALTTAMTGAIMPIGMLLSGPIAEIIGILPLFILANISGVIFVTFMWFLTNIRALDLYKKVEIQKENITARSGIVTGK